MERRELWTRKATGLIREISPLVACISTICIAIGAGWQKRVFQCTGWSPMPENTFPYGIPPVPMAFLITGIPVLCTFFCLGYLAASMPRSGGGYIHISRVIHPLVGFVASWLEYAWWWLAYGMISTLIMESVMMYFGLVFGSEFIAPFVSPVGLTLWGLFMIALFAAISCLGVRWFGWLMQILFWVPIIIVCIIFGLFLTATPGVVESGILALTGHTPVEYTTAALNQGMATAFQGTYWDAVSVALIAAAWAWTGFAGMTFAAGEIKEASKKMIKVMMIAGVFLLFFYTGVSWVMANTAMMVGKVTVPGVGDYSFFSAWGFLSYGKGSLKAAGLPPITAWLPILGVFVAQGRGLTFLLPFVGVVGALWLFNDLPVMALASSRLVFSMSFDGILPKFLSDVNERWHTPIKAIWFTTLLAIFGVVCESGIMKPGYLYPGPILYPIFSSGIAAGDLWDFLFFTVICLTAALLPYRRKDIYDRAPVFKGSIGGVPLITVVGLIGFITNLYLDWGFIFAPIAGIIAEGIAPFAFTLFLIAIPIILYYYYKWRAKVTGRDYKTIFAELPPE